MPRKHRPKPAVDRPVMVRVAANRLGRDALCVVPGCRGELRIDEIGGYTVEICTKCERRLQLWGGLEAQLRAATMRVQQLEARVRKLEPEVVAARAQVQQLLATPSEARAGATLRRVTTSTLVLSALEAAGRALTFPQLQAMLPPEYANRLSPTLCYMAQTKRLRARKIPWGRRYRMEYALP